MSPQGNTARVAITEVIPIANARPVPEITWIELARRAPQMVSTMARYLEQLAVSARPGTVVAVQARRRAT